MVGLLLLLLYKKKTKIAGESSHHDLIAPTPNDDGSDDDGSLPEMEGEIDKNNGIGVSMAEVEILHDPGSESASELYKEYKTTDCDKMELVIEETAYTWLVVHRRDCALVLSSH